MQKKELKKIGQILFMTVCVYLYQNKTIIINYINLQAEKMRAQLASLPPLRPPKLPQVSKESSMPPEGLNTGIYRRTDQLLATLLKLSAEVKVVDITGKTAGMWTQRF